MMKQSLNKISIAIMLTTFGVNLAPTIAYADPAQDASNIIQKAQGAANIGTLHTILSESKEWIDQNCTQENCGNNAVTYGHIYKIIRSISSSMVSLSQGAPQVRQKRALLASASTISNIFMSLSGNATPTKSQMKTSIGNALDTLNSLIQSLNKQSTEPNEFTGIAETGMVSILGNNLRRTQKWIEARCPVNTAGKHSCSHSVDGQEIFDHILALSEFSEILQEKVTPANKPKISAIHDILRRLPSTATPTANYMSNIVNRSIVQFNKHFPSVVLASSPPPSKSVATMTSPATAVASAPAPTSARPDKTLSDADLKKVFHEFSVKPGKDDQGEYFELQGAIFENCAPYFKIDTQISSTELTDESCKDSVAFKVTDPSGSGMRCIQYLGPKLQPSIDNTVTIQGRYSNYKIRVPKDFPNEANVKLLVHGLTKNECKDPIPGQQIPKITSEGVKLARQAQEKAKQDADNRAIELAVIESHKDTLNQGCKRPQDLEPYIKAARELKALGQLTTQQFEAHEREHSTAQLKNLSGPFESKSTEELDQLVNDLKTWAEEHPEDKERVVRQLLKIAAHQSTLANEGNKVAAEKAIQILDTTKSLTPNARQEKEIENALLLARVRRFAVFAKEPELDHDFETEYTSLRKQLVSSYNQTCRWITPAKQQNCSQIELALKTMDHLMAQVRTTQQQAVIQQHMQAQQQAQQNNMMGMAGMNPTMGMGMNYPMNYPMMNSGFGGMGMMGMNMMGGMNPMFNPMMNPMMMMGGGFGGTGMIGMGGMMNPMINPMGMGMNYPMMMGGGGFGGTGMGMGGMIRAF